MKRITKHLMTLLLSMIMVMAMGLIVFAEGTGYTLTLTGTASGHTYEAYQIFKGDLSNNTLSNIDWGSGVDGEKTNDLLGALKNDKNLTGFDTVDSAATVADALAKNTKKDNAVAQEFATVVSRYLSSTPTASVGSKAEGTQTQISGLKAGYYLVKDKDDSLGTNTNDQNASYTRFILEVVGDTTTAVKSDVPTVTKKVEDKNDSTGDTSGWQDSADADINDDVQYQITGTMPDNIVDYKKYTYKFTDTMSKGLTYTAKNAKITIGEKNVTSSFTENVTTNDDGSTTVTWTCDNLKGIGVTLDANTKVVVTYSAKLNESAVIGSAGNPNTVNLTYSNNPNKGGDGETGKTPDDKNVVFTYKTVVNKVDQDKKSLAGAAFKLEKKLSDGSYKEVKSYTAGEETTFEFTGLDDGNYRLTETTTPAGYNTITPVEFTISAKHDVTSDDPKLTELTGEVTSGNAEFAHDTNTGSLTTDIENKKGSILPSTGGRGTTMIYIIGAVLVVMAGVVLAVRKKMSSKES